jgi:hypothetical protein
MAPIPPVVFIIGLAFALVFYAVTLSLYYKRRHMFPIQQRLPYLVLLDLSLLSVNSIGYALLGAYPENAIIANCYYFAVITSFFQHIPTSIMTYRLVLIFVKDLQTKAMMQEEKFTRTFGSIPMGSAPVIQDYSKGNPFFKFNLWLLNQFTERNLSLSQIAFIWALPSAILGIADVAVLASQFQLSDALIFEHHCLESSGTDIAIKIFLYSYYTCLLSIGIFSFFKMEDNFAIGKEIRGLLTLNVGVLLLLAFVSTHLLFEVMRIRTRSFEFILSLVVTPAVYYLQAIRPIQLSIEFATEDGEVPKKSLSLKKLQRNEIPSEADLSGVVPASSTSDKLQELIDLLEDPSARNHFLKFLESEFSVENLFFVEYCILFKNKCKEFLSSPTLKLAKDLCNLIRLIRDTFVLDTAVSCVNVSSKVRQAMLGSIGKVKFSKFENDDDDEEEKKDSKQVWVTVEDDRSHLMVSMGSVNLESMSESRHRRKESQMSLTNESATEKLIASENCESLDLEDLGIEVDMFEKGRVEILQLMATDSFLRFRVKQEGVYREFLLRRNSKDA